MEGSRKKLNIDWEKDGPKPPDVSLNPWVLEHKKAVNVSRKRDVVVALFFLASIIFIFLGFYYGIIALLAYSLIIIIDIIIKRRAILKTGLTLYGKFRYIEGTRAQVYGGIYLFLWIVIVTIADFAISQPGVNFQINIKTVTFILISIALGLFMGIYSNKSRAIKFENRLM